MFRPQPGVSVMVENSRYTVKRNAREVTVCALLHDETDDDVEVQFVTLDGTAKGWFIQQFYILSCIVSSQR